jgi:hypothetical protein
MSQFNRQHADAIAGRITYAAVAAMGKDQPISIYNSTTFYTVERDNAYPYPLEDIPHLILTSRYSGATMPKNEIVFRHIFERGLPATRKALQACRTYAVHAIRKRIGIALQTDDYGDPITVVTEKADTNSDWYLTGDIRVRFPSKRSANYVNFNKP